MECESSGATWHLDVWLLDKPARQPSTAHLTTLRPRLTDESRAGVIEIKRAWADLPEYGTTVNSFDAYRAVLDDRVRDPARFETWVGQWKKPRL
ncbi:hypothetical protein AB0M68_28035 [Streptomyces sp. NPDC051453]|uniref:hypothetical protein n=1 Tax=Streptomyces sp. NPDC051453 TaxID=3154941 RepID=UPI00341DE306